MRVAIVRALTVALAVVGMPLAADGQVQVRSSVLFESYSFDDGLILSGAGELIGVSEMTIPLSATFPLQGRGSFTVSTAYVRVELESLVEGTAGTRTLTGPTDVEARLSLEVIPDRLVLLVTGALPTGNETLEEHLRPVTVLLATEALDFSVRSVGTGGNVGVGLAAAVPAGEFALGLAGTVTRFGSFEPLTNSPVAFQLGNEIRLRGGIEGPLTPRSYLRVAGIFSRRGEDQFEDTSLGTPGNSYAGYASLDQSVGRSSLTVYALDSFRGSPQLVEGILQPRGNLLAAGAQVATPVGSNATIIPRIEYRQTAQAVLPGSDELTNVGSTFRAGADLSLSVARGVSLIFDGDAVFGALNQGALPGGLDPAQLSTTDVNVSGFRAGVHLEIRR